MIDYACPDVPAEIFNLADEEADLTYYSVCEDLWEAIYTELMDPFYSSRSHHNVGTYNKGCRGPLCRKANREHPRRAANTTAVQLREQRLFDPVLEYFHIVAKHRIRVAQREILTTLKEIS